MRTFTIKTYGTSPESKDRMRATNLWLSGHGAGDAVDRARSMADKITDKDKIIRRLIAVYDEAKENHPNEVSLVLYPFCEKARKLGVYDSIPSDIISEVYFGTKAASRKFLEDAQDTYPSTSELPNGIYNGYWYDWTFELEDGRCFKSNTGLKRSKRMTPLESWIIHDGNIVPNTKEGQELLDKYASKSYSMKEPEYYRVKAENARIDIEIAEIKWEIANKKIKLSQLHQAKSRTDNKDIYIDQINNMRADIDNLSGQIEKLKSRYKDYKEIKKVKI